MKFYFYILIFLIGTTMASANPIQTLQLDQPWGNHMVLQAGRPAHPSGSALAGAHINIQLGSATASTTADAYGRWKATLPALTSKKTLTFRASSGDESIVLTDILLGEVWLASGQSNMEWRLAATSDATVEVPLAKHPEIRLFTTKKNLNAAQGGRMQGQWTKCTPDTAKDFSAVAYHFGLELLKKGVKPLGLIVSAWSGTSGEAWVSNTTSKQNKSLDPIYTRWEKRPDAEKRMYLHGWDFEFYYKDLSLIKKDGSREKF